MSKSATIEIILKNKLGLHARPASNFVKKASEFESEITIEKEGETVNGKSLIELLMLAAEYNTKLKITAKGPDAYQAIEAIETLIKNDKGFNKQ
ncbi:MAG: HPr family phosphocarrier protein [Victivallales bacterium]|nr:HPr family phosphocarrier protein [Victivallales bacterium]